MGCDIHFFVERRSKSFMRNKAMNGILETDKVSDSNEWEQVTDLDFYDNRNYRLFGLLAGVRGGPALFDRRGFPENISYELQKYYFNYGYDGHSTSYITLSELIEED